MSRIASLALLGALGVAGCLDLRRPARDSGPAAPPPAVLGLRVLDADGNEHPLDAIPRAPILRLTTSSPLDGSPDPFLVLSGEADPALRDDLSASPARSSTLARAIVCERDTEGLSVLLRPTSPLEPGARLVVAVAGWAHDPSGQRLGAPYLEAARVGEGSSAGARAIDAWPPDGTSGVGTELPLAAVRFDGAVRNVEAGLWLEDASGGHVEATTRAAACDEVGWSEAAPGGSCVVLEPRRPLAPATAHALVTGPLLLDATGAPVPPFAARFSTALGPDTVPPGVALLECALDESATPLGCALADDGRVVLRLRATEAVRVQATALDRLFRAVAPRGEATIEVGALGPDQALVLAVTLTDAAGQRTEASVALSTTPPLPPIAITEVLANPSGTEPRQEWIEIQNLGAAPFDLAGLSIADAPASPGDPIEGSQLLWPGARALLVSADFDPLDRGPGGQDAPIPAGAMLVRLDRSLATGGLSNTGEPLFLRDAGGHRLSAAPAWPPPREAVCLVRVSDDPRTGAAGSFGYDPTGSCSPGW